MRLVILPQAFAIARAADGRLSGAAREEHGGHLDHRLRGADASLEAINNATFEPFTVYGLVALIYFAMCFPLTRYARHLQLRSAA